jgi:hypothetical protein
VRGLLRFLLPLILLVAAPLLGVGGRAQASFILPHSLAARPNPGSFLDGTPPADGDAMEASPSMEGDISQELHWLYKDGEPLLISPASAKFGTTSGGDGCSSPSEGPGSQSTSQSPALTTPPPVDAPALKGVLFLETAQRRPPPFPSRLFRPPRLS